MKVIESVTEMNLIAGRCGRRNLSTGFVPTMGALHEGHLSLIRRARIENDVVVASIFVNSLQFGPKEDFKKYPRTLSKDLSLLKQEKVDFVFTPSEAAFYPPVFCTKVDVPSLAGVLEGKIRPGHFLGVATVLVKLFNIVHPSRAYFGLKDFQQVCVVKKMVEDLNIPVHVIGCRTVREKDGLALSSRNRYLSASERQEAIKLYQALFLGRELISEKIMRQSKPLVKRLSQILSKIPNSRVDYIALVDPETLLPMKTIRRPALLAVAVKIGKTRLIDNIVIS